MSLFTDPAYEAVAIMLALLVLTPWALLETERLRTSLRHQFRAMPSRSRTGREP